MKIVLCESCGRVILRGFVYCPYCGIALHAGPQLDRATDEPFRRLESMQTRARAEHIDELMERLNGLEADVEEMLNGSVLPG